MSTPIEAIDPATNQLTHSFSSVAAAEKAGFCRRLIHQCLSGKQTRHKGLCWRRAAHRGVIRGIEAFDQQGLTVHVFSSIREATEAGYIQSCITECLGGRRRTHRKLRWHPADDGSCIRLRLAQKVRVNSR